MGTSPIISGVVDACTNTKKAPSISTWCLPAAHEATGLTRSMVFKKALLKILMKLCAMRSVTITDSWRHGMSPEGLTRALVPWIYIYIYTLRIQSIPWNDVIICMHFRFDPIYVHGSSGIYIYIQSLKNVQKTLGYIAILLNELQFPSTLTVNSPPFSCSSFISIFHGRLLGGKSGRWRGGRHRGIRLVRRRHAATPRPVPAPFRPQGRTGGRCGCRGHRGTGAPGAVSGRR